MNRERRAANGGRPGKSDGRTSLRILPLSPHGRLIVFGDIHGCIDELQALLDRLRPGQNDLVISTGDIVRKGPDAIGCLQLWRERGYHAVLGNNEDHLLSRSWIGRLTASTGDRAVLGRRDLVSFLRSWPAVIDVPDISATIVHGGLFPEMKVTKSEIEAHRNDLIRLRWIRKTNGSWERVAKGKQRDGDVLWPTAWNGERTVLYGHTPLREPRIDSRAIGLDTGCVYGGSLTAAVWQNGTWGFVSERARRAYSG